MVFCGKNFIPLELVLHTIMKDKLHDHQPSFNELDDLFGEPTHEIHPSKINACAGVIIGLLAMTGAGVIVFWGLSHIVKADFANLPFYAEKGTCWFSFICVTLGICVIVGMGIFFLHFAYELFRTVIYVCPNGFYVKMPSNKTLTFLWEDIATVEEFIIKEKPPLLVRPFNLLLPSVESRAYNVIRKDGVKFDFNRNTLRHMNLIIDPLREQADQRNINWTIRHDSFY